MLPPERGDVFETGGRVPAHFGVLPPLGPDRPEADEVERPFSNGIKCLTWSCCNATKRKDRSMSGSILPNPFFTFMA